MKRIGISAIEESKECITKTINNQERKDLKKLADDFCLLQRKEVQEIIKNCRTYSEGQQKIMKVYTAVYMH